VETLDAEEEALEAPLLTAPELSLLEALGSLGCRFATPLMVLGRPDSSGTD